MLFTSLIFAITVATAFIIYWFLDRKQQNILILAVSILFYAYWDWRFLGLLFFVILTSFFVALFIEKYPHRRRSLLYLYIFEILLLFFIFKYFGFFITQANELIGSETTNKWSSLKIILPIGISFYLFQSLAYVIDVWKKKQKAETDLLAFSCFVIFFPQLIAGPIERSSSLLVQIKKKRQLSFSLFYSGVSLIFCGLVKKIVIADNLGHFVGEIAVINPNRPPYSDEVILMTIAFGIQILADFSAYTDIARGTSKLFGIELTENFKAPYFANNIREFWRRWHITLSSWFRDYVFIPLGGNRVRLGRQLSNIMIVMLLSGIWHGAGWNFLLWGAWHGSFMCLEIVAINIVNSMEKASFKKKPLSIPLQKCFLFFAWLYTLIVVFIGWFIFRIQSLDQASFLIDSVLDFQISNNYSAHAVLWIICSAVLLTTIDFYRFVLCDYLAQTMAKLKSSSAIIMPLMVIMWSTLAVFMITFFGSSNADEFIYFAF